jgi:tRNA(adenine34) deaminase
MILLQLDKETPMPTHETCMRRCLDLGRAALAAGEVPVGSLVVRGEEILGEGQEAGRALLDPSAHAEVQAIRAACRRMGSVDLSGCTLYSTVEPCVLCAYALRRAGISRVVYGVPAGQAGGATSRYAILTDTDLTGWPTPPEIIAGVLAEECAALLRERRPSA